MRHRKVVFVWDLTSDSTWPKIDQKHVLLLGKLCVCMCVETHAHANTHTHTGRHLHLTTTRVSRLTSPHLDASETDRIAALRCGYNAECLDAGNSYRRVMDFSSVCLVSGRNVANNSRNDHQQRCSQMLCDRYAHYAVQCSSRAMPITINRSHERRPSPLTSS